jgi:hypothetical protein
LAKNPNVSVKYIHKTQYGFIATLDYFFDTKNTYEITIKLIRNSTNRDGILENGSQEN